MSYSLEEISKFTHLYSLNIIPLRVVLSSLTWVIYDYFATLEDEIQYIWGQRRSLGKSMYLFIRYYTVFLLVFDVAQIHSFAIPGVTSDVMCVAMDPITRFLGAINLWAIEIVMQIRIYALFNKSKKVVVFNAVLFFLSIVSFIWIMVHNALKRHDLIASAIHLPLPGCPTINAGIQWAQWVPATCFEFVMFGFVLFKIARSVTVRVRLRQRMSLTAILIGENILYFIGITALLIFNNLMVIGATKIPWFSFGPFHAAMGIMTTHMLMHLKKVVIYSEATELPVFQVNSNLEEQENNYFVEFPSFKVNDAFIPPNLHLISSLEIPSTLDMGDIELAHSHSTSPH